MPIKGSVDVLNHRPAPLICRDERYASANSRSRIIHLTEDGPGYAPAMTHIDELDALAGEADELRAWMAEAVEDGRARFIREIRGMTQRDVAGEFGISQSEVSKLENGHHLPLATPHLVYAGFLREADPFAV